MKHSYIFALGIILLISNPGLGQNFTNMKINHMTAGDQNTDGGNKIAVHGYNVYLLWQDMNSTYFSYVSKSTDGGETFKTGVKVGGTDPHVFGAITTDNSGSVYVVWVGVAGENLNGVYFAKSIDEATTFSAPMTISADGAFPQIAVYGSNVYVFFCKPKANNKIGYYFARSTNGGSTFAAPYEITDASIDDITWDTPNAMCLDNSGNIYCVWNDGRRVGAGTDIYFAKSTNSGVSFGPNVMVNEASSGTDTIRTGPSIAAFGSNVYAAWREGAENSTSYNTKFSNSTNGGSSFSTKNKISHGSASTSLSVNSKGEIFFAHSFYLTNKLALFCSKSTNEGNNFVATSISDGNGNVKNPSIFIDPYGILFAVWTDTRSGNDDVYFAKGEIETASTPLAGDGTIGDPYQIATLEDLRWIAADNTRWNKQYIQTADIDASATPSWNSGAGWAPIGTFSPEIPFTGSYNGQNHKITGMYINRSSTDFVGLFGYIANDATIKNLGVEGVNITGRDYVSALVGWQDNSLINNCYSKGSVTGRHNLGGLVGGADGTGRGTFIKNSYSTCSVSGSGNTIGGLVGNNYVSCFIDSCYFTGSVSGSGNPVGGLVGGNNSFSTVERSYSTGSVTGTSYVGGLVGLNNASTIRDCYSACSVTGTSLVGGLVGSSNAASTIASSYSTGSVSGSGDFSIGGLVGQNYSLSIISHCYSSGPVTGKGHVGGFVGTNNNQSTILQSYTTSSVMGTNIVGGFVGINANNSEVRNCYSRGNVTRSSGENAEFGGFVGNNSLGNEYQTVKQCYSTGSVFYSGSTNPNDKGFAGTDAYPIPGFWKNFWDNQASNQPTGIGATGKTTAEMKTNTTFLNAGWDSAIWNIGNGINNGYPYLKWQNPGGSPLPVEREEGTMPKVFTLKQNYPNPFNPSTNISFHLASRSHISLKVFDLLGREVATLVSGELPAGNHIQQWNATDVPSGVYYYRLETGRFTATKKLLLIK